MVNKYTFSQIDCLNRFPTNKELSLDNKLGRNERFLCRLAYSTFVLNYSDKNYL